MKKNIYSIMLLAPALILGMTKDGAEQSSQLVLDPSERFTPQVFRYFGVHQSLQHAYKSKKNQDDLRFLAHRLYYLTINLATTKLDTHNAIPEDRVSFMLSNVMSLVAIAEEAWRKIHPTIISISDRQDWTPDHTQEVLNNFWNIYSKASNSSERKKQKEEYDKEERGWIAQLTKSKKKENR